MTAFPNKHVPVEQSLIGLSALLIAGLRPNDTVSSLWDRYRDDASIRTFDRFASALTILYAGGLIQLERGLLRRTTPTVTT